LCIPAARSAGSITLIWKYPVFKVGADPAYSTCPASPPTVTDTACVIRTAPPKATNFLSFHEDSSRRPGDFMKQLKKTKRPVVLTVKGEEYKPTPECFRVS